MKMAQVSKQAREKRRNEIGMSTFLVVRTQESLSGVTHWGLLPLIHDLRRGEALSEAVNGSGLGQPEFPVKVARNGLRAGEANHRPPWWVGCTSENRSDPQFYPHFDSLRLLLAPHGTTSRGEMGTGPPTGLWVESSGAQGRKHSSMTC